MQVYKKIIAASALLFSVLYSYAQNASETDLSLKTIAVDAGHGGKDSGAVSADRKTYEKTLTLKISKLFAQKVKEAYPQMNVILTRSNDASLALSERARIASKNDAQLFISVHINAVDRNSSANGFSAWILGPSQKYDSYDVNLETLKRENSVIYLEDDATTYKNFDSSSPESEIFLTLMQNAFREQSLSFAETLSKKMGRGPFKKTMGVMQDNFYVLRLASMPAVLLEFGFISNDADLSVLRSDAGIEAIVDNMLEAFKEYKTMYDHSVSLGASASEPEPVDVREEEVVSEPEQQQEPASAPAPAVENKPSVSDGILYGTQVIVSGKKMNANDPFFKGYEFVSIPYGNMFKYVIGFSNDREEAKKIFVEIKKKFPDSFFVKIEDNKVSKD